MNNFSITKDGKEYWIARNVAVVCFTIAPINGEWHVLANQRGSGAPDFQGCWNAPCGYLDYNETTEECAIRETFEETGVKIKRPIFWSFNDIPSDEKQNVTFRYYKILPEAKTTENFDPTLGEKDEVRTIRWIPIKEIKDYDWAFGHDLLIRNLAYNLELWEI